jgi:4-amino-4-deoxy-L-arabinose transferase-like glycosyltransferase
MRYIKNRALIILTIAVLVRVAVVIITTPSSDACTHLKFTLFFAEHLRLPHYGEVLADRFWSFQPPFYYILVGLLSKPFLLLSYQTAFDFVKLSNVIFGSLQIVLSYLIIRKFSDENTAFWALVFLAFVPLHIYFSSVTFLDILLSFLITLSLYLLLKERYILSAISLGCGILTKNSILFFLPVAALFFLMKRKQDNKAISWLARKGTLYLLVAGLVGSGWLLRNYIVFHNPFFPFLLNWFPTNVMRPENGALAFSLEPLLSPRIYAEFLLGWYGLPHGRIVIIQALFPGKLIFVFLAWLLLCMAATLPLFAGIFLATRQDFSKAKAFKPSVLMLSLIGSFLVMLLIYFTYWHESFTRLILPSITAYAFFWAQGTKRILAKAGKYRLILLLLLGGICLMFVAGEIVKASFATSLWNRHKPDFEWIKRNTPGNAKFYEEGDLCFQLYTDRLPIKNPDRIAEADYIFLSRGIPLIPWDIANPLLNQTIKNYSLAYYNPDTKTYIYKKG